MAITELDISEIVDQTADAGLRAAANAPRTVRRGLYAARFASVKYIQNDRGQKLLSFTATLEKDGNRVATVYFDGSPRLELDDRGKLSKPSRLYGQLTKAVGLGDDARISEVIEAFQSQVVGIFVSETLKSPEGQYIEVGDAEKKNADGQVKQVTPERAADLVDAGHEARNYVQSLSVFKG